MKIEMGESLLYSWLRHVKECQVVQTNWKASGKWELQHEEEIEALANVIDENFSNNYGYSIFKKNSSVSQMIHQTECDVMGINLDGSRRTFYAVEVAFHEGGLNYGTREETIMKVIAKCARIAMCLYGYMDTKDAEIIFTSPKIMPSVMGDIMHGINDLNNILRLYGYEFCVRVIANEKFNEDILQKIIIASDGVSDTAELFMRGYQMYKMFADDVPVVPRKEQTVKKEAVVATSGSYSEFKIGQLARFVMRPMLESGMVSEQEIQWLQDADYCKRTFDLQYPLLIRTDATKKELRYYAEPLYVNGVRYRMCSEWFEVASNNDRPYLEKWIKAHEEK